MQANQPRRRATVRGRMMTNVALVLAIMVALVLVVYALPVRWTPMTGPARSAATGALSPAGVAGTQVSQAAAGAQSTESAPDLSHFVAEPLPDVPLEQLQRPALPYSSTVLTHTLEHQSERPSQQGKGAPEAGSAPSMPTSDCPTAIRSTITTTLSAIVVAGLGVEGAEILPVPDTSASRSCCEAWRFRLADGEMAGASDGPRFGLLVVCDNADDVAPLLLRLDADRRSVMIAPPHGTRGLVVDRLTPAEAVARLERIVRTAGNAERGP